MSINTTAKPTERRDTVGFATSSKITPYLWFNDQAEEAMKFYMSIFRDSKVLSILRDQPGVIGPKGKVMSVTFELNGQEFIALNGGPQYKFNEAVSLFV